MRKSDAVTAVKPALYPIPDAEKILGLRRRSIYKLIGQGKLDAVRLLGRTLITDASVRALIASAPAAGIREQA